MPAGQSGLRWIIFVLGALAVAQQQQPQDGSRYQSSPPENSRAIATLAPAEHDPAVRAPLSASTAAGSGLTGRRSSEAAVARSLRDWEVEDLVLLATIDGRIHAVDRKTGRKQKWTFPPAGEPSRPIVNTQYHRQNYSGHDATIEADEWLWIVEPTEDGALYIYKDNGLQKIAATVKTLTDMSTYASSEEPFVIYTAKKDATLFTLNAATGRLIKEVSSDAAMFGYAAENSCPPVADFESVNEECESRSHFMIARTDYTVVIRNQSTLEPICTIRYSEWAANGRDRDLGAQYQSTLDNNYILSRHDGHFLSVDAKDVDSLDDLRPRNQNKLSAPVVRVFDVARHVEADPNEASLVILPQPSLRFEETSQNPHIFVNCTESGGWYAMSEQKYPFVTSSAKDAQCYSEIVKAAPDVKQVEAPPPITTSDEPERKAVRFDVPEQGANGEESESSPITEPSTPADGDIEGLESAQTDGTGADTPKKKKAHRGQRGGKKRKKKTDNGSNDEGGLTEQIGKQIDQSHPMQPDEISASGGASDVSGTIVISNLEIFTDRILGYGSGGTTVFEGRKGNRDVAVKRVLPQYIELATQEVALLEQSDDHPNVIRYYDHQRDNNFIYIAVEKCQASLFDLYREGGNIDGLSDDRVNIVNQINSNAPATLHQIANGLAHLHKLRLVHRDIKPQNILIAIPKKHETGGPRLVISDFGLCKTLPDQQSTLAGTIGNVGTTGWKAPELVGKQQNGNTSSSQHSETQENSSSLSGGADPTAPVKRACDIFSLGCVFFFVLTNGAHPFDCGNTEQWTVMREVNIKSGKSDFSKLDALGPESEEPKHLISWMLEYDPRDRPSALQVKNHPFFWSASKRLTFLCEVSDHFEREPRDPPSEHLQILESKAFEVIPNGDFLAILDRKFTDTLGKQRKYQGHKMVDLLRALRNKKNHYADMPEDVKAKVGSLSGGYLRYWTSRFPVLLVRCFDVLEECGLGGDPRFEEFFGQEDA
ncbi:kinase-like protein [Rhizodiscina lignyota]|uniref:non-specific serine/threonine protein kinase n=1 Tax=Rhizodiscina lignyota TaxID=1504668 RepID=A0A9P4I0N3_9PEZI|nr:kinase-like protein [Rhizodiscina lignyota]